MRTIVVKEKFGGTWRDSANYISMRAEPPKIDLLEFWQRALALYITKKRVQSGKAQKEVDASRKTVSDLENFNANPTLDILLNVLTSVGGNISEAFESHTPKAFHGDHQALHEMLQRILETGDSEVITGIRHSIKNAFELYVVQDRNSK